MKTTTVKNLLTILTIAAALPITAWAQDKGADKSTSDKVDLKKLEDKYWSAKDDEYGVIQNRTFSKAGRLFGAVGYGTLINDPYAKGKAINAYLGWYFNEDFGLELNYLNYQTKKNDSVEKYESLGAAVYPNYNLLKSTSTVNLVYTPFYAKMAFMNTAVLYFDMGFTIGYGMTQYEQQKLSQNASLQWVQSNEMKNAGHFEIGVMQQMFINRYVALRLDLKNTFYNSTVVKYQFATDAGRPSEDKNTNDTTLQFSFMMFFNPPKNK